MDEKKLVDEMFNQAQRRAQKFVWRTIRGSLIVILIVMAIGTALYLYGTYGVH